MRMKRLLATALFAVAAFLVVEHYRFHDEHAIRDVQRLHPEWSVIDVGVGEGDDSCAYVIIRYRITGSSEVHSAEWQYFRQDGRWILHAQL